MAPFETDPARFIPLVLAAGSKDLLSDDSLTLARESGLSVQWIPSGYVLSSARLAIVGITPGRELRIPMMSPRHSGSMSPTVPILSRPVFRDDVARS